MRSLFKIALFLENCVLPALFFWAVMINMSFLFTNWILFVQAVSQTVNLTADTNPQIIKNLTVYVLNFSLLCFESLIFISLVIKKKMQKGPENLKEVLVPLASTYFFVIYGFVKYFPPQLNLVLISGDNALYFFVIGGIVNFIGIIISSVAIYNLRYSFSIYVEIRDVVGSGFYKFVRHPIYSGYILSSFGFILMMPRLDFLILAVASIALLFYRAALEEQKLLKNSVLYCEYAKKTPAFFPWYRA